MKDLFYRINCQYKKNSIRIEPEIDYNFRKFFSLQDTIVFNSKFKIVRGNFFYDVIPFDTSLHFAVSEKFVNILKDNHIYGIDFFSIQIVSPIQIWGIVPISKAGRIINLERLNNLEDVNIEFEVSSWDGSDIFCLQDTLCLICTQNTRNILKSHNITNVSFEPCFGI